MTTPINDPSSLFVDNLPNANRILNDDQRSDKKIANRALNKKMTEIANGALNNKAKTVYVIKGAKSDLIRYTSSLAASAVACALVVDNQSIAVLVPITILIMQIAYLCYVIKPVRWSGDIYGT